MAANKITITDKLRVDIIEKRKSIGISSYALSERVGNGHSKYWLQNIESGKTQKITKEDLISLYMAMDEDAAKDEIILEIEQTLNQPIGDSCKRWYELITISEDFSEIYEENALKNTLDELLDEKLIPEIRNTFSEMSTNQKQAVLTAVQNLCYSLYKNSELAYVLMNIPIYGVKEMDVTDYNTAMNDLLSINAKYNDLVIKNRSLETIKHWNERDEYYNRLGKKSIQMAFDNFKNILLKILDASKLDNPDLFQLSNEFNTDVTFLIERGEPNVMKRFLKSFRINDGKGFMKHIKECYEWFRCNDVKYDIQDLYSTIPKSLLNSVYEYLSTVEEIEIPPIKITPKKPHSVQ